MRHLPFVFTVLTLIDKDVILAAMHKAGLQKSKMKLYAEIDPCLFDRQLEGEGHLRHETLLKLPAGFMRWYCLLMLERVGLPREVKRAIPVTLALAAHKRMAKVTQITRRQLAARKETA